MAILYENGFETGNFAGLDDIAPSGLCNYFVQDDIVCNGDYAAKLTIQPHWLFGKAAVRLAWMNKRVASPDDPKNLPDAATYSCCYYLPARVETPWLNLMQWKGWLPNGERAPIAAVRLLGEGGKMTLNLRTRSDTEGKFVEDGPVIAQSNLPVPVGEWFEIKTEYEWGQEGWIATWLNDQLLWEVYGIPTEFAPTGDKYPRQWAVGNYAAKVNPYKVSLYVDDLKVEA